jgi:hypothetical protein
VTESQTALLVSGCALAISISGFIWSIWKEFIFVKPRVQATFSVMNVISGESDVDSLCVLNTTNMGPGTATLSFCLARQGYNWRRRATHGMLNPIEGDPAQLPHTSRGPFTGFPVDLAPGKSKSFYFPYGRESFLQDSALVRFGVQDTYGRNHWCRRADVIKAQKRHREDFPEAHPS